MKVPTVHKIIISVIIAYAVITYFRVDPDDQFGVLQWFPVFIITAIYVGSMFVKYVLPNLVFKATNSILGSNAEIEHNPLHDARAASARGDYEESLGIYQSIAAENPDDPQVWLSQAMIQQKNLENPPAAIKTLRKAISSYEWPDDEKAFFMSRIAGIQIDDLANHEEASITLQDIIDTFPKTRHSVNATHKLDDLTK